MKKNFKNELKEISSIFNLSLRDYEKLFFYLDLLTEKIDLLYINNLYSEMGKDKEYFNFLFVYLLLIRYKYNILYKRLLKAKTELNLNNDLFPYKNIIEDIIKIFPNYFDGGQKWQLDDQIEFFERFKISKFNEILSILDFVSNEENI